jgi:hypothetical protein
MVVSKENVDAVTMICHLFGPEEVVPPASETEKTLLAFSG